MLIMNAVTKYESELLLKLSVKYKFSLAEATEYLATEYEKDLEAQLAEAKKQVSVGAARPNPPQAGKSAEKEEVQAEAVSAVVKETPEGGSGGATPQARGRPEKKVKKVVNKGEMVEETITEVLAEASAEVVAPVVPEGGSAPQKKKAAPRKKVVKAEAPVVAAEVATEVVAEVAPEVPAAPQKKKATPRKKAEAVPVAAEVVAEASTEVVAPVVPKAAPQVKAARSKAVKDTPAVVEKPVEKPVEAPAKGGCGGPAPQLREEELDDDEEDEHEEITYKGVTYYLKLDDQTVYDKKTEEFVGNWNAKTEEIEFEED